MTTLEALVEKATPFLAPIPGNEPCGKDPTYDAEFEAVKAEIDKLTALSGEQPDWHRVISLGDQLLKQKAKDLRLAIWVGVARQRTLGLAGLAEGMTLTHRLCVAFWDGMTPDAKRARARANLVGWMGEQAAQHVLGLAPSAADRALLEAVEVIYKELDALLTEKLGELYPGMGSLRSAIREKTRQLPAEEPKPAPLPPPAERGAEAPAPVATASSSEPLPVRTEAAPAVAAPPPASLGSAEDVLPALRAVGKTIVEASRVLRRADPAQPWSYRLQRTGIWLPVKAAPPTEGRSTRIPAPRVEDRRRVEGHLAGQRWVELLEAAEDLTSTYIFWFDLHRLVAAAMDRLGAPFLPAREVVGRELFGFLARTPAIETLTFADGTPFADSATEAFLQAERDKWGGESRRSETSARVDEEDAELSKRFEEARELVTSGKVGEGLSIASQLANRGADARTRFRARLAVASLSMAGGKPQLARPILEGLVAEAERHHLEDWEPALCASVFTTLLACRKATSKAGDEGAFDGILDRLCRLDPGAALRILG